MSAAQSLALLGLEGFVQGQCYITIQPLLSFDTALKKAFFFLSEPKRIPSIVQMGSHRNISKRTSSLTLSLPRLSASNKSKHLVSFALLLLLVFHELYVVFGNLLVLFENELLDLAADIALDDNLLAAAGYLGYRRAGRELLAEVLGNLSHVENSHC